MTGVENEIPDNDSLVKKKKTVHDTKISEIEKKVSEHNHGKYITTPEFNNLTAEVFTASLKQANLMTKTDFNTRLINLNKKINSNKRKHVLLENKFKKL